MNDTVIRKLCVLLFAATTAATLAMGNALAQQAAQPETSAQPSLSLTEIESRLAAEGLKIEEIELYDRVLEVEALDANGREVDLVIDRRTGETLSRKFDD